MKWPVKKFLHLVDDVTGGNAKIQKKDYLERGEIPVIDQGQSLVAGYTNDTESTFSGNLPVVIFGDHTRILKFIDYPFVLGADGVKVLAPKECLNAKFLYYYLNYLDIPNQGYSRHFKFLKVVEIPLPALSEQLRIVEILDQADQLLKLRFKADTKAELILPALFNKMFGDPATNPMGWKTGVLGDVIIDAAYGTSERADEATSGIPVLRMNNVNYWGYLNLSSLKYIENGNSHLDRYLLKKGDLLFNRTNSSDLVGKTGLWNNELEKAVPASYLIRVRVDSVKALPEYIWAYMNTPFMKQNLHNKARRAIGMANINAQELRSFPLVLPGSKVQEQFAKKLASIIELAPLRETANFKSQELFDLLMQHAFSGTLTATWREAHMKELLAEMEQQAKYLN